MDESCLVIVCVILHIHFKERVKNFQEIAIQYWNYEVLKLEHGVHSELNERKLCLVMKPGSSKYRP